MSGCLYTLHLVFFKVCAFLLVYLNPQLYFCLIISLKLNLMNALELFPIALILIIAVALRRSQVGSFRKIFTIALLLCSFASFGQMSSTVKDSLTIGTVAKDTTLQVFTSKTGAKFLVLWSDKSKKYYRVYLPKRKD